MVMEQQIDRGTLMKIAFPAPILIREIYFVLRNIKMASLNIDFRTPLKIALVK
jgi:hypothetical protein